MTVEIDYFIIQLFKLGKINNILISGGNGQLFNIKLYGIRMV